MKFWIKAWVEILDDRKMGHLTDTLWRRAVELFLLAGRVDQEGQLPPLPQIAWELRVSEEQLNHELEYLASLNIIAANDEGYMVSNFAKRQAKIEATERKRQQRIRETLHHRHNVVTKSDTDMQNMHDDDDKLKNNAYILGGDLPGFKDCNPQLVQLWADKVEHIPEHWGVGLIINQIKAGKLPPNPPPALELPPLPADRLNGNRHEPDPVNDIWRQAQTILQGNLTKSTYTEHIKPARLLSLEPTIRIQAKDTNSREWIETRLLKPLTAALTSLGQTAPIVICSKKNGPANAYSEAHAVERTN